MWTLSGFADEISPDFDEQCRVLNQLHIGHVEVRSAWGINMLDLNDAQLDRLAKTLAEHELSVSSVGSPIGKIDLHDDFDAHMRRFDHALQVAAQLQAPYIRIFSFFIPAGQNPDSRRDEVLRRMTALAQRARGHEVILLHENEKNIYGDIPRRCVDIVESVGSPQLKLAWDPANFVECGVRPHTDGYRMLRPHLEYMQIKDAVRSTKKIVPAGQGDGQVADTVRSLRADGFDGFFSLEPHLAIANQNGGFSSPELFAEAHQAFTGILRDQEIEYR